MSKSVKFISIFLVVALVCAWSAAADAKPTVDVKRGSAAIDGQIDDIWQYVDEMKLDRVNAGEKTDSIVYAKMLWDDENLYILAVAIDNTKHNTEGLFSQEDCFEVYFDLNNEKTDSYSEPNQFRFLYDILTPFEDGMRFLDNIADDPLQYIEIAGTETDTGYIMEARINSKVGIGFELKENMEIGIDFGYDDNTEGDDVRTGQLTWNSDGSSDVANVPAAMGTIRLVNEEAMPPAVEEPEPEPEPEADAGEPDMGGGEQAAPAAPTAPPTGDMAIIFTFAAFVLSGIFAAKRKKASQ